MPAPCVLHPERIVEYPHWDLPGELGETLRQRFDRLKEETGWSYWYHLSVAPGIKAGGYPNWTQQPDWPHCDGCGKRMDHLLTVDSAEFDGGTASAWLPQEDRPAVGTIFDLPYERRRGVQSAPDLMTVTWAACTSSSARAARAALTPIGPIAPRVRLPRGCGAA
jgi:hypothetical protein